MKIYRQVMTCLDMSRAEYHQFDICEQLRRPGERAKIIALARKLSGPVLDTIIQRFVHDNVPIAGGRTGKTVLAYGAEAIVFSCPTAEDEKVIKLYYGDRTISEYLERTRVLQTYLGTLVEPQSLFEYENSYSRGSRSVGAVQKRVDGVDFFTNIGQANPDDVLRLWSGSVAMFDDLGCVPDFIGHRNVLIDQADNVRVVDHGLTRFINNHERTMGMQRFATLAVAAGEIATAA